MKWDVVWLLIGQCKNVAVEYELYGIEARKGPTQAKHSTNKMIQVSSSEA